jgi:hypothetical protein
MLECVVYISFLFVNLTYDVLYSNDVHIYPTKTTTIAHGSHRWESSGWVTHTTIPANGDIDVIFSGRPSFSGASAWTEIDKNGKVTGRVLFIACARPAVGTHKLRVQLFESLESRPALSVFYQGISGWPAPFETDSLKLHSLDYDRLIARVDLKSKRQFL